MPYASLLRGRVSLPGHYYCVTTTTQGRRVLFSDLYAARIVVSAIRSLDAGRHCETLALVVMPDHVHWLFRLGMFLSLSEVVRRFKARSARELGLGRERVLSAEGRDEAAEQQPAQGSGGPIAGSGLAS